MKLASIFIFLMAVATIMISPLVVHGVTISASLPGTYGNNTSTPGAFIANFYQFSLAIGGVLAFAVIVYGGIRYMTSAGNPSGQSDAKEWIKAAIFGILLLAGAYFVLNIIDPELLNLNLPSLNGTPSNEVGGGSGNSTTTTGTPGSSSFPGFGGGSSGGAGASGDW